jgi:hypothetical protein
MTATLLAFSVIVPLLAPSATRDCQFGRTGDPAADQRALAAFDVAVREYAELHRRLEPVWPPAVLLSDPEQAEAFRAGFRARLTETRPTAAEGALFTAEVADVLRVNIAAALRRHDEGHLTASGEGGVTWWMPGVHDPLPWGAPVGSLHAALPPLPPELDYRVVGRDLVLLDVDARMVVDVLRLAIPTRAHRDPLDAAPPDDEFIGCLEDGADEGAARSRQ